MCLHDSEKRKQWGCDETSEGELEVFWRTCVACDGRVPECETCKGQGKESLKRCPASQVDDATMRLMRAYRFYDGRQTLPAPGSLNEQAASFVRFVDLVDNERGVIEKERRRIAEISRKARKKR